MISIKNWVVIFNFKNDLVITEYQVFRYSHSQKVGYVISSNGRKSDHALVFCEAWKIHKRFVSELKIEAYAKNLLDELKHAD